jgi:hypothetical protein
MKLMCLLPRLRLLTGWWRSVIITLLIETPQQVVATNTDIADAYMHVAVVPT